MRERSAWQATAQTWLAKAVARSRYDHERGSEEQKWLIGYDAGRLLGSLLDAAEELVPLLNLDQPDELEDAARQARALAQRIRDCLLAEQLSNVEGRTPEEAEAFLSRAALLRKRAACRVTDEELDWHGGASMTCSEGTTVGLKGNPR